MVYRVYVEKKKELANEAKSLLLDIRTFLGIKSLEDLRVINRYDVENISKELFNYSVKTVLSEPQVDQIFFDLKIDDEKIFAVESLKGQFDQRADSAEMCIQMISKGKRPTIKTSKVYVLKGDISNKELETIKEHIINKVESKEASLEKPDTLSFKYEEVEEVQILDGFIDLREDELKGFIKENNLAMDEDDLRICRDYFKKEERDPSITEIKVIDTYWSDHCRHTTFSTIIDNIEFEDKLVKDTYKDYLNTRKELGIKNNICLMDMATIGAKYLKKEGKLPLLDESEEINACSIKIDIERDGKKEPWILFFKNETHNHPTEIEPFGGAATCIGGAIRDPLSGRAYVYAAMRLTGAANPLTPLEETIKGKLPQREIVRKAALGYSSYGNQIGVPTGIVDEVYHPGYAAKRMEIGAVIGAAPRENIVRERPKEGDTVILLGGRTGRDGIGGATGSSKAHDEKSVEKCGAEVQKGNPPEERKIQRLFRNSEASRLIKRCNDFGAGGVSVAIGELADGLVIDLDKVPKKYEGLDGTELAISESQERMAVVVEEKDCDKFLELAYSENLEAVRVAVVTKEERLVEKWKGKKIVDISRKFLDSNGAKKHVNVLVKKPEILDRKTNGSFKENILRLASDNNICSKKGLTLMFDSTIGAGTVLMPLGGKKALTPIQAMVHKISTKEGHTSSASYMSYGFNPYVSEKSQFHGAYYAVVESVSKLIATGASFNDIYLSFQEYFEKLYLDKAKWGKPVSALLGAYKAQKDLGVAAIGGKDSMSGTFEDISVPPTLVSFAVTTDMAENAVSPEFKKPGNKIIYISPKYDENNLPVPDSLKKVLEKVSHLLRTKKAVSCYSVSYGGIGEAIIKMSLGNLYGVKFNNDIKLNDMFLYRPGSFVLEVTENQDEICLGEITKDEAFTYKDEVIKLSEIRANYENKLEDVYKARGSEIKEEISNLSPNENKAFSSSIKITKPKVLIPVFPGTNCEYDVAKAVFDAGSEPVISVINNIDERGINKSIKEFARKTKDSQMIFIPGGFSGGDEPDGSAKFITAFFRSDLVRNEVTDLIEKREGLICGICNGFQALIKLGLVPYGKIIDLDDSCPTLTYNASGKHKSSIVRTKIVSNKSPWLKYVKPGEVYMTPISHGEGRFYASIEEIKRLSKNGQIATQYVDENGNATYDIEFNPNGSVYGVEGITSPDGRIFGKMGHSERIGKNLYKNIPGEYDIHLFEAATSYFRK